MAKGKKAEVKKVTGATVKAAILTICLIAAALAIIAISSLLLPDLGRAMRGGHERIDGSSPSNVAPQPEEDIAFLEENFALRAGFSSLNVLLVIYLLFIHTKDYLTIKSSFTLGLVAFLFSFLLYALASSPFLRLVMGPLGFASMLSFVPMLFSALGLLIFTKLSNE